MASSSTSPESLAQSKHKPRVAFLGPLASFSHQAALECFGSESTLLPQPSFNDAFGAIQSQEADYATIPLENSTNGSIVQTLDLLADREGRYHDITVCGEYYLSIHHCLLDKKGSGNTKSPVEATSDDPKEDPRYKSITKLYSHPQVWGQCEKFLSKHFNGIERQDVSSTSKAAEIVAHEKDTRSAAIASKFAAQLQGLNVLKENIEDTSTNTTRFIILRNMKSENTKELHPSITQQRHPSQQQQKCKSLISFMVDHNSPGALADALVIFKRHGMNLTSINSRPGGIRPWQYVFFVECQRVPDVHDGNAVKKVMDDLRDVTEACRDLGSWKDQLN